MITRFSIAQIGEAAPPVELTRKLRESTDPRDRALFLAICSLERIAGADSPEGDNPETDALRNLRRIRTLIAAANQTPEPRSNDAPSPGASPPLEQKVVRIAGEQET